MPKPDTKIYRTISAGTLLPPDLAELNLPTTPRSRASGKLAFILSLRLVMRSEADIKNFFQIPDNETKVLTASAEGCEASSRKCYTRLSHRVFVESNTSSADFPDNNLVGEDLHNTSDLQSSDEIEDPPNVDKTEISERTKLELSAGFDDLTQLLDDLQTSLSPSPRGAPPEIFKGKEGGIGWACVLFDCDGDGEEELSLKQGDTVKILAKDNSGWWAGEHDGRVGLFPANYVEEIEQL